MKKNLDFSAGTMKQRFEETNPMYEMLAWFGIVDRDMIMVWIMCGLVATYLHKKITVLIPAVVFGPLSFLLFPPE